MLCYILMLIITCVEQSVPRFTLHEVAAERLYLYVVITVAVSLDSFPACLLALRRPLNCPLAKMSVVIKFIKKCKRPREKKLSLRENVGALSV